MGSKTDKVSVEHVLDCIIEEAAEVIKAATKCKRFGYDHYQPGYGRNDVELAREIGDLIGVSDMLDLNSNIIDQARETKPDRVTEWYKKYGARK